MVFLTFFLEFFPYSLGISGGISGPAEYERFRVVGLVGLVTGTGFDEKNKKTLCDKNG